jgi:hypothetical protein
MKCPVCLHDIPRLWQKLYTLTSEIGTVHQDPKEALISDIPKRRRVTVWLRWMRCPNDECRQILVEADTNNRSIDSPGVEALIDKRMVVPRVSAARTIDPVVRDPFRRDYLEASLILDDSPRWRAPLKLSQF